MLLTHRQTGVDVDVSLGVLPFEAEAIERSQPIIVAGGSVPVPTPGDLIILKAFAHRRQDMADIERIAAVHPDLDREQIRHWVTQFAELLEMPEIWEDVRQILDSATRG